MNTKTPELATPGTLGVQRSKKEISKVVETTKDLLVELLRIQKQIDLYDGREERFVQNTDLQSLLGDLTSLQEIIDQKQNKVKGYIAKRKAKRGHTQTRSETSIVSMGIVPSNSPAPFGQSKEESLHEEDLELGSLLSKTLQEMQSQEDETLNTNIIVRYAQENQLTLDASEISEDLKNLTVDFYTLQRDALSISESLGGDHKKPLLAPNPLLKPSEEAGGAEYIHFELSNMLEYITSLINSTQVIQTRIDGYLSADKMLRIFSLCNNSRVILSRHKIAFAELKELLETSDIHLNPIIVSRLKQEYIKTHTA